LHCRPPLADFVAAKHNDLERWTTVAAPDVDRLRSYPLLTESEVSRSWTKLFKSGIFTEVSFEKAEALLEELRPTSPLRHRLMSELEELRQLHGEKVEA
jgi:hypothetical protein